MIEARLSYQSLDQQHLNLPKAVGSVPSSELATLAEEYRHFSHTVAGPAQRIHCQQNASSLFLESTLVRDDSSRNNNDELLDRVQCAYTLLGEAIATKEQSDTDKKRSLKLRIAIERLAIQRLFTPVYAMPTCSTVKLQQRPQAIPLPTSNIT